MGSPSITLLGVLVAGEMFGESFSRYKANLIEEAICDTLLWVILGEAFEVVMFWKVKTEMALSEVCSNMLNYHYGMHCHGISNIGPLQGWTMVSQAEQPVLPKEWY